MDRWDRVLTARSIHRNSSHRAFWPAAGDLESVIVIIKYQSIGWETIYITALPVNFGASIWPLASHPQPLWMEAEPAAWTMVSSTTATPQPTPPTSFMAGWTMALLNSTELRLSSPKLAYLEFWNGVQWGMVQLVGVPVDRWHLWLLARDGNVERGQERPSLQRRLPRGEVDGGAEASRRLVDGDAEGFLNVGCELGR